MYQTTNFKIKNFLAYGYNDTSVVVKCTDSLNAIKYLTSYETGYKNKKGNPAISFKNLSYNDFEKVKTNYKWFKVDKEKYYEADKNKFLFMLGALLSLLFLIISLLKSKKIKATD